MEDPNGTAPVNPGDVLAGKYRVDRILGVGGMGVVVAATHLQLEQKVALKFMLPWALQNAMAVERFAREARAAVRLKSEHVARVLDVGTLETGSPYLVMEFLEGVDLHDLIHAPAPAGRVSVEESIDYLLQACDAVAEAHALGIVHRDLKPRNLFLTTGNDGKAQIKVLDFGISKMTTPGDLSLTRTTEIMGSPNYMSPEQLKSSRGVDERSDIWALGVILYEMLGGNVPFVAETLTQLTAMVLTEPPKPLKDLRPDVPQALLQIISRCLEKDATKRFQTVAELAMACARFAPEHARGLADRVRRIAGAVRAGGTPGLPGDQPSARVVVPGSTGVTWAETELGPPKRRASGALLPVAGALVFILGGAGVYVAATRHTHEAASPTSAGSVASAHLLPTASGSAGASSEPAAAEPIQLSEAAPATPPPVASAGPLPSPATKPTRPRAGPKQPGKGRDAGVVDDMPSDRL